MRLLVTIPLCDYEPIATRNWTRLTTYYIVKACLSSFRRNTSTPLDLYVLADRCSERMIDMARSTLAPFEPTILDNSSVDRRLDQAELSEKLKHICNQFLKTIELASGYDVAYFCEQDYLFSRDAVAHGLAAFEEIPEARIVSLFDHPDRHNPDLEPQLGRHAYYPTRLSTWKSVSSTNGNFMWRGDFLQEKADWILAQFRSGGLDHRITSELHRQGVLMLSPTASLIQHFRLDGSNASPTFGRSVLMSAVQKVFRLALASKGLRKKLGIYRESL